MKIDVYIPTYNRKELLRKAIDSVVRQTYSDVFIMVSDNASTDGTNQMISEVFWGNTKIQYHRQPENIGPSRNFQKCIYEYGTGEFALFLSDDDELIDNEYIEKAVRQIENHENMAIVMGNTRIFYSDLNLTFDILATFPEVISGKEFFLNYWTGSYSISWCNALFRRDLAIQNDCYNGKIFYADSDCFFRLMMFGNVWFIDTIASLYRVHAKNSYKVASVETYLENESYIHRNYDFALAVGNCSSEELSTWKNRLLSGYRATLMDNLILFSEKPYKNFRIANIELKKRWFMLSSRQKIRLSVLFISRFFIRFKPIFRLLVSRNYKK